MFHVKQFYRASLFARFLKLLNGPEAGATPSPEPGRPGRSPKGRIWCEAMGRRPGQRTLANGPGGLDVPPKETQRNEKTNDYGVLEYFPSWCRWFRSFLTAEPMLEPRNH